MGKEMKCEKGFVEFLKGEEKSENTIASYCYAVADYAEMFDEITKNNMIEYKKILCEKCAPATVNLRLIALHKYCEYKNIPCSVKLVKTQKHTSIDNVITMEEYNRLLNGLENDGKIKFAEYIKILAKTGARISEFLNFTKADFEKGYKQMHTKGKIRKILFPEQLCDEVKKLFEDCDSETYICPITSRGFAGTLKKYAKMYDVPVEHAYPHSFRHLFAIEFLKRNNNIALLADLLGHSGVNTTMIYLRLSQEQQKDALNKAVDW